MLSTNLLFVIIKSMYDAHNSILFTLKVDVAEA